MVLVTTRTHAATCNVAGGNRNRAYQILWLTQVPNWTPGNTAREERYRQAQRHMGPLALIDSNNS